MFPPVEWANEDGVLAVGGDLSLVTLRTAYTSGIFPWPVEGLPLLWFAPPQRAVLFFDELHVPRRAQRELRKQPFEFRIDTAFEAVIRACAAQREQAEGTWISDEMREAYIGLHQAGHAHSVETYLNGELAGGLYGVSWGGYFSGESMFFHVDNASKAALIHLVQHLQQRGASWLDVQVINPFFDSFGAREVPRARFMKMLKEALKMDMCLFSAHEL